MSNDVRADQRQRITASVFSRINASGEPEENYVSHIKIWEDAGPEGGGRKPRYILLSQSHSGTGYIHKSKLNTNNTFSVGKTWRLADLRAIHVYSDSEFSVTLSRSYKWQTEHQNDQAVFLDALIQLFRSTGGQDAPLQLIGISEPSLPSQTSSGRARGAPEPTQNARNTTTPGLSTSTSRVNLRSEPHNLPAREPSTSRAAASLTPSRPPSPTQSARSHTSSRAHRNPPSRSRPSSPGPGLPSILRPGPLRQASTNSSIPVPDHPTRSTPSPIPPLEPRSKTQRNGVVNNLPIPPDTPKARESSPTPSRTRQQTLGPTMTSPTADLPSRRDANTRISVFDPANQFLIDQLAFGNSDDLELDDDSAQATLGNVEEIIEGYEWAIDDVVGRKTARGAADLIEARLLDELMALEKANIHSFLESDDRITTVLKYMDEAINELDSMASHVSSYKIHLNAVGDDISYVQSQNRGLQVQTQNQRALLSELQNVMQTVHVDPEVFKILAQESLEQSGGITRLEEAATDLYKALLASREKEMAATIERLQNYQESNTQFCKRIFDFLTIMFSAQVQMLLGDNSGVVMSERRGGRPRLVPHKELEAYLGRYSGLVLYVKETEESIYSRICGAYFSAASELHNTQIKALLSSYLSMVKKAAEDDLEQISFAPPASTNAAKTGVRRAGTIIKNPMDSRNKDKDHSTGDMKSSEVLGIVLEQLAPMLQQEDDFLTDFLQINESMLTFADYMNLDNYFRRQASRTTGIGQATMKLVRGAMDLVFGFLHAELKTWIDIALAKDNMWDNQIFGIIACLERFLADSDERGARFFYGLLDKQHTRLKGSFDRHVAQQIQGIEQTKVTSKKRQGVAHFIRHFPVYVSSIESQLLGTDGLEIRTSVDAAYERIVGTMFESLKQMAKMEGEGEDKGQLNYHVILVENMHHFVAETAQLESGTASGFVKQAETLYEENLQAYVKIVLRRPFSKLIDYFEGVERLLKTTAPTEVSSNSNFNRSALKKVVKEYNAKDVRKHVDVLFKRVEKHFTEASEKTTTEDSGGIPPGTVMVGVWKACEEELLRITELVSKRISQCYADAGVSLEYSPLDVESAFKRHRVGS